MYAGDTSSSSGYEEIEAVPTAQGLRFGDLPSPSGSEFGSPRASVLPDSQAASLSWLGQPGSTQEGMSALAAAPAGAVAQESILPGEALLQGPEVSIKIDSAAIQRMLGLALLSCSLLHLCGSVMYPLHPAGTTCAQGKALSYCHSCSCLKILDAYRACTAGFNK